MAAEYTENIYFDVTEKFMIISLSKSIKLKIWLWDKIHFQKLIIFNFYSNVSEIKFYYVFRFISMAK